MKKREERKYFDKEWKDMKASLESYLKKEQQEDLHHFRVQVKKLRAFLILSDSTEQHPKLTQHFKSVRMIFKQAGEIRSAYINLELGKAHQTDNGIFMSDQHQLQLNASSKFKSNGIKNLEKLKDSHQLLKEKIKPVSDLHINLFYQKQLHQIADILTKPKFDDQLHTCRKQVKILIYNHKLTHAALGTGVNTDYLDLVQIAIGDWHDHVLAIELFSSNEAKDQAAVSSLKKQDSKFKNHITSLTKDFYNRATTVVELPVEQLS
jgi:CHAD domain-containing protein